MNRRVYLDYNASTPVDPRVAREMARVSENFGNPSSIHAEGREARALIDDARLSVGELLRCDHREIVFTSGGTEANNLALLGFARANRQRGNHLITSAIEHSSILNACRQLEREGFQITYVPPTREGLMEISKVEASIRPETILISIMLANNEVGTLQPIAELAKLAHDRGIAIHTDAIQALGKVPVDVETSGVDLLSISAHKIYGPQGVGALYVRSGTQLFPLMLGGTHERGLRPGTENVVGIHGLGVAAKLLLREGLPDLLPMRSRLETGLSATGMAIICKNAPRLPNTVDFFSSDWLGESMVMAFDLEEIAVSNGSACASGIIEPSHVILALGYNEEVARSVIRVSFGKFTQVGEIEYFLEVVRRLEKIGRGVAS